MKNNIPRIQKLIDKAKSYNNLKKYIKAIDCYDQALHIDPKHKYALN